MDKSQHHRESLDEKSGVATDASRSGWWLRGRSALSRRAAKRLDRIIAVLHHLRLKLAPIDEASAEGKKNKHDKQADVSEIAESATKRGPLTTFLFGIMLLVIGIIVGALFSFNLFALKIESQSDFIARQAEEVFEYDKDARRAERALEKSRTEARELQQQFEETRTELQQAKTRLAEIEGRASLYGSSRNSLESPVEGRDVPAATRLIRRYPQRPMPDRNCDLGSSSVGSDLSRCLNQAKR